LHYHSFPFPERTNNRPSIDLIENLFDLSRYQQLEYVHFDRIHVPPREVNDTDTDSSLKVTAAALETLPVTLGSTKILISLTFRNWNVGCDTIGRMDAFLANYTTIRKVEIITMRDYEQERAAAEFPLLSTANKLGIGMSEETYTIWRMPQRI
jgi:hypothetical protein